jgi:hypothetical protein
MFLKVFKMLVFLAAAASCVGVDPPEIREVLRKDFQLLDCGQSGGLPSRMADCGRSNPEYSRVERRIEGRLERWFLVAVDLGLRLEFWVDETFGRIWTNPMPYKQAGCQFLSAIDNGDKVLEFRQALTADYKKLIRNPVPRVIRSSKARYFTAPDSEMSGVIYDEVLNNFVNIEFQVDLWQRCVGQ